MSISSFSLVASLVLTHRSCWCLLQGIWLPDAIAFSWRRTIRRLGEPNRRSTLDGILRKASPSLGEKPHLLVLFLSFTLPLYSLSRFPFSLPFCFTTTLFFGFSLYSLLLGWFSPLFPRVALFSPFFFPTSLPLSRTHSLILEGTLSIEPTPFTLLYRPS